MLPHRSRPLFVIGMHRSGTTMVTRALHEAGVFSGAELDHNQEPLFAIGINDTLLNLAGGCWWQPPALVALDRVLKGELGDVRQGRIMRDFMGRHQWSRLRARLFHPRPWVLKDPRLCLTLPWWLARFPSAKVLWVQRDPIAVVDSLLRRQQVVGEAQSELTATTAHALVERYDEASLRSVKISGVPFLPIRYESLTSADETEQRAAWAAVYDYAGAKRGRTSGFAPKTERPRSLADDNPRGPASTGVATPAEPPLVSVIVPNYNHAPYLDARIRSIVDQSYKNIEILLMDDCSPDNSREVLESWAASDERITLLFNEANSGSPFHQWQKGARWAQGKYLWIAESDDVADLDMLATHVAALEHNERAVLAYSQSAIIDENGERISSWNEQYRTIFGSTVHWESRFTVPGKAEVAERMVFSNTIPNASGVLFRKSAFDQAGVPETTWKLNGDWLFYARLLQLGDLEYFPEERNKFRLHRQTQRMRSTKAMATFFEVLALLKIFETESWADGQMINAARREVAGWWARSMFHAPPTAKNLRANATLYRQFSRYNPRINRVILKTALSKAWRFAKRTVGLPPAPFVARR